MAIGALVGIVGRTAANLIKNAYKNNERNKTNSSEDARLSSGIGSGGSKGSSLIASGKSSPTTIYGPDGSLNAGYISNGQTYFQDGTRIADGYSSVDNSGRVWTMRNGQGVLTGNIKDGWGGGNGFGNFSGGFDQGAGEYQSYIDEMRRQEEQAAYARAEAERAAVEASKNSLNQQYNDAARQAYILAEKQKRDIPNIMSAQGMSGGATESQLLTADTNYQNNINNLEAERMAALANLDVTGGDIDAALSQTLAGIGTNYNGLMLEYYRDQQQQAEENALRDRELFVNTIGQYSDDYQAQIDRLLAQGVPESDYRIMYLKQFWKNGKLMRRTADADQKSSGTGIIFVVLHMGIQGVKVFIRNTIKTC